MVIHHVKAHTGQRGEICERCKQAFLYNHHCKKQPIIDTFINDSDEQRLKMLSSEMFLSRSSGRYFLSLPSLVNISIIFLDYNRAQADVFKMGSSIRPIF